jgi:hypothetical protein
MPEMMEHEEIPELKKEMLELYKKFLEAQLKHIGQLPLPFGRGLKEFL